VLEKKNPRLKNEQIRLHKEFMPTACSEIDVKKVRDYASQFAYGDLDFNTGEKPVKPTEPPVTPPEPGKPPVEPPVASQTLLDVIKALINKIIDWLSQWKRSK
jgi:hypothetical protein